MQRSSALPASRRTPCAGEAVSVDGADVACERNPYALVVDDAPDIAQMLAVILQLSDYDVVPVFSAQEALEAAQKERFDVVVSDIGMPGMDGYELAKALRALPEYQDVPLVAITGFSEYNDRRRALEAGFNAHLCKPIDPQTLIALLGRLRNSES